MIGNRKLRVLVVDDSALVRQIVTAGLSGDPGLEVVGTASDPFVARDKIVELRPDVLTLDVEMPRMDGVEFLRRLMPQHPIPVVMLSSLTQRGKQITFEAMEAGAVDFVSKPAGDQGRKLQEVIQELRTKVKIAAMANVSHWKEKRPIPPEGPRTRDLHESTDKVIAIGASTGGTEAIRRILPRFPVSTPGIVIVQHMPPGFTKMFADRLNTQCQMEVREAQNGDRIVPGRVLIAPGGVHLRVRRSGGIYEAVCRGDEKVSGHCPSVDVMMQSVAADVGANAVGVMLTGMGSDGAEGMLAMRKKGARTVVQDEATCVVYGMPKVALEKGGGECARPLDSIPDTVLHYLESGRRP
ncbi:MAG TPA: chemotaxis response regulator protein-glutamate methylesterase [Fibrobacteria bacterium]|nr:chemotaxis response regulator protein-glutamate methylesterase [Fibrobacteria bacterium]